VDVAYHHFSIARSLRPRSGIVHAILGITLALKRRYREAQEMIEAATALEPDSTIIWMMAADFYSRGRQPGKAAAAARKALELDPSLRRARQILEGLGSPASRTAR
jgi:predicted Zn-dependent protease